MNIKISDNISWKIVCKYFWREFKVFRHSISMFRDSGCEEISVSSLRKEMVRALRFLNIYAILKSLNHDREFQLENYVN